MDPLKTSTPPEAKLHFLDYWRIIRIRKTVILAVFLLVVITATIVTFILPEAYSSKARIKVERDINDVAGVGDAHITSAVFTIRILSRRNLKSSSPNSSWTR